MLAQVLVKNGTPSESFELRELSLPELMPGQVRIKVTAFGLNYADVMARQGIYRECPPLPCVIGYDVEGVIDAVAEDVLTYKVGEQVFALTRFGGYAQYVTTGVEGVGRLPEGSETGVGCALATQYVTAVHAAVHCQTLMPGEKVLIHAAAGGLGTALIQIALWKGCIVIGVAGGRDKMEYLKSLGVQHPVNHHEVSYLDYVRDHFEGRVDVVFDNIGGRSFKSGKSILARGGRIVTLGAASLSGKGGKLSLVRLGIGFGFFSPISYLTKSQNLIGVNMLKIADHRPDIIAHVFQQTQELYKAGVLKPHVGKIYDYKQIGEAQAYMEDRKSIGKIVVRW